MLITFVRRHDRLLTLMGLLGITLVVAIDIVLDLREGLPWTHLLHEIVIVFFCIVLFLFQWRVITRQQKELVSSAHEIAELTKSREEFRLKSLRFSQEFSRAVEEQFAQWSLTESERDVAILLIKGMSMKEIAEDRESKEATVRQQATAIYRKAGLSSRQDLAAFFLEDLFTAKGSTTA